MVNHEADTRAGESTLREAVEKLLTFVAHSVECPRRKTLRGNCICGLSQLWDEGTPIANLLADALGAVSSSPSTPKLKHLQAALTTARLAVNDFYACATNEELERWRAAQNRLIDAAKAIGRIEGEATPSAATSKRVELGLRLGQILGPEYDGVSLEDIATELVQTKAKLQIRDEANTFLLKRLEQAGIGITDLLADPVSPSLPKWIVVVGKGSWAKCYGAFEKYDDAIDWCKTNQYTEAESYDVYPVNTPVSPSL